MATEQTTKATEQDFPRPRGVIDLTRMDFTPKRGGPATMRNLLVYDPFYDAQNPRAK